MTEDSGCLCRDQYEAFERDAERMDILSARNEYLVREDIREWEAALERVRNEIVAELNDQQVMPRLVDVRRVINAVFSKYFGQEVTPRVRQVGPAEFSIQSVEQAGE